MGMARQLGDLTGDQTAIDPAADFMQGALARAFTAGGTTGQHVKNMLHGTRLGHPLHPALVSLPIGAWSLAVTLDAMSARGAPLAVAKTANTAIAFGNLSAMAAAAAGLADWGSTDRRPRRIGLVHGALNSTALLLFTWSWLCRRADGNRPTARWTARAGYGFAMVSALLGGDLVFGHRIGVNHAADEDLQALPKEYVPVLEEAGLAEGTPRKVDAAGVPVLLVRRAGRIFAIGETCSHLGGPLAEGELTEGSVICPWHASRFALEDGRVIDGPATFPVPCFETRVRDGQIELRASRG